MRSKITPFADQLVACLSEGRDPTVGELLDLAARIWIEGEQGRSALGWRGLPSASTDRTLALRMAKLALCGA